VGTVDKFRRGDQDGDRGLDPRTFEYLDFAAATVTEYPAGADRAQLFVCPAAAAPCDCDDYVAGGFGSPSGPTTLASARPAPGRMVAGELGSLVRPCGSDREEITAESA
jgi:hypothetical protein